ncbi:hypothetical protein T484DRAFT_1615519, partial [Baffinella frigidus]
SLLCYVMLCYVMLCYVMLCYVMLCYVMLCYGRKAVVLYSFLKKNYVSDFGLEVQGNWRFPVAVGVWGLRLRVWG